MSGGHVEWHELTDEAREATFSHPAGGRATIRWDSARVKRAELTSAMHRKCPREMLRSRVVSAGVRTIWPMATSGMYVPEEVVEFAPAKPAEPFDVTPKADLDQFATQSETYTADPETSEVSTLLDGGDAAPSAAGLVLPNGGTAQRSSLSKSICGNICHAGRS